MPENGTYDVQIEQLPPRPIAVIRARARFDELSSVVPRLCGEAWEAVKAHPEVQVPGALMLAIYHPLPTDDPNAANEIDIAVGVEVSGSFEDAGSLSYSTTPEGNTAHTTHLGPYQKLGDAHAAVKRYCEENGHKITGVRWEVYGHWTEDESRLQTDVFYSLT